MRYVKRLIEVDLPIKRISAHARREKSIRHGHISTLHIWWARRPLAACRAVICASLWPDPADDLCPQGFRKAAIAHITEFAKAAVASREIADICDNDAWVRYGKVAEGKRVLDASKQDDLLALRNLLLDYIADAAAWAASTNEVFLRTARKLTQAAHEALGGAPGTQPLVVDPFAGGGSIPLEALRVGADAFASDLNPVAVLLNKVVLEYIPKYGQRLADEVRKWGQWVKEQAEKELAEFYPKDPSGATPIAYLWARTIQCEGPGCGAEVPLIRSQWLCKKRNRKVALKLVPRPRAKRVDFEIVDGVKSSQVGLGTVSRGSVACPVCGYTTPVKRVRQQLSAKGGGAADARHICTVLLSPTDSGRHYRLPKARDGEAVRAARHRVRCIERASPERLPLEHISTDEIRRISVPLYGLTQWADLYSPRQLLSLVTITDIVRRVPAKMGDGDRPFRSAVLAVLAMALSKEADLANSLCSWKPDAECPVHMMARQAIGMVWDYAESVATSASSGSWASMCERTAYAIERAVCSHASQPHVAQSSATKSPLPDDSTHALVTDPPYYDAVPYAHLSDFFYVWLRRTLADELPDLFSDDTTPKASEIVVDRAHRMSSSNKGIDFYETELQKAFKECGRIVAPDGIGTIVFASKTTSSWEAILRAVVDAGWMVTGSWPIDTEMDTRIAAKDQARLASSIHIACRPRKHTNGLNDESVGDWRTVLHELPVRIHDWMPRLAEEGVVGADAIFACLGPALEIFSRYSRVEKASGEEVSLREYLEQVWGAVAKEALDTIFRGADTRGFDQDARLTAIWFWVMKQANGNGHARAEAVDTSDDASKSEGSEYEDADDEAAVSKNGHGYAMEFDAARKLAQGLGADLVDLAKPGGILAVQGNIATMLSVSKREEKLLGHQATLFGDEVHSGRGSGRKRNVRAKLKSVNARKASLFDPEPDVADDASSPFLPGLQPPKDARSLMQRLLDNGTTMLDRLHQAMLLFGRAQTALLRPFLGESGMGQSDRFWTLAQALSALYPPASDEKRWVDGVLARKKSMGF